MAQPATPDIQTYINTLKHHRLPDGGATGEQLNFFLGLLQGAVTQYKTENPTEKEMIVFGKEVAYNNASHRDKILVDAYNSVDHSNEEERERSKEAWNAEMRLWGTCVEAVIPARVKAINLFLVAAHPNIIWEKSWAYRFGGQRNNIQAKEEHYARQADWHAYAIKVEDKIVWIYDPSYQAPTQQGGSRRRLNHLAFMNRAWELIQAFKTMKVKIGAIFLGGGGNDKGICQDMACKWLRGEVMNHLGQKEYRVQVDVWEELAF